MTAGDTGVRLTERLEQTRLIPLRNTDAGIADLDFNLHLIAADGAFFYQNVDVTAFGEFNRIPDKVGNDLLQAQRIANDVIRHVVFNIKRQLKAFVVRRVREQRHHLIERTAQRERNTLQDQLARFQLGEVEHVVDDRQQVVGRTFNGVQVIALSRVKLAFQRQAGKADHAIERRTQLVRHIGKEFRLNTCRFLGALFRQIQLNVLDLHLLQRFAQVGRGLVNVVLHLFVIRRQRHGHRVDAVLQHVQLTQHKPFHPAVELAAADAVNRINHVADGARHVAHQAPAEDQRNANAEQHHHARDKNFFVLL